jgi:hypothetical protein
MAFLKGFIAGPPSGDIGMQDSGFNAQQACQTGTQLPFHRIFAFEINDLTERGRHAREAASASAKLSDTYADLSEGKHCC